MSIENGKDYRNILNGDPELHMKYKEAIRLTKFKIKVFKSQLRLEKITYDSLKKNEPKRFAHWKPKYKTVSDLDEAYVAGLVDDKDYMYQRYAIWQVYSDRGHINNIAWMESEIKKYEKQLADIENYLKERNREAQKRARKKLERKKHKLAYKRKVRRKKRTAEREQLWRETGIGRYRHYGHK